MLDISTLSYPERVEGATNDSNSSDNSNIWKSNENKR